MTHHVMSESSCDSTYCAYHIGGRPRGHSHAGPTGGMLGVLVFVTAFPQGVKIQGDLTAVYLILLFPCAGLLNYPAGMPINLQTWYSWC